MQILQYIINGIALGSVYALISTGFSVIFNVLKFSNFSHGALMTLSAFVGYFIAASNGWGLVPTIIVAVITGCLVALFGELLAFRRILIRNTSPIYFFVSSITLGTLFEGIVVLKVGANFYNYPRFFGKPLHLGSLIISQSDIIIFCISAFALIVLAFVIQKTKLGRALRSVSFDRDTASLMGIDVTRTIQFAFIISGALAGLAGVFLGINYTLYPTLGSLVVKGFIASVIGGLGSLPGAIIGAMLLGIMETALISTIGSGYAPVFTFLIMLVFLLVRPRGIAGSNIQEKA
ncbi:MAG TPA: branched-chain amino acid ABC transporter permease [Candidatus Limiplasma sp.]|nr:branched-chain amino acid ABC transporter permease [Candidatus Limiplasma sp.]HPS82205.1 branched-chain amino acid ABC transporter permease [Candidatus Limiplasma sp.]